MIDSTCEMWVIKRTLSLLLHPDKPLLLEEIRVHKQLFCERLDEVSEELMEKGERWGWPLPTARPPHRPALHLPKASRRAESNLWPPSRPLPQEPHPCPLLGTCPYLPQLHLLLTP